MFHQLRLVLLLALLVKEFWEGICCLFIEFLQKNLLWNISNLHWQTAFYQSLSCHFIFIAAVAHNTMHPGLKKWQNSKAINSVRLFVFTRKRTKWILVPRVKGNQVNWTFFLYFKESPGTKDLMFLENFTKKWKWECRLQ